MGDMGGLVPLYRVPPFMRIRERVWPNKMYVSEPKMSNQGDKKPLSLSNINYTS